MEREKEVRSKMTLYDEWLRSAAAFEKNKKKLDESEQRLKEAEKKNTELEEARQKAEADHQRFQLLVKVLLDQGRTEDTKKALEDPAYREGLLAELAL